MRSYTFIYLTILPLLFSQGASYAETLSGNYLAARNAVINEDHAAASDFYTRILSQDQDNQQLINDAIYSFVLVGDLAQAIAALPQEGTRETQSTMARVLRVVDAFQREDFAEAGKLLKGEQRLMRPIALDVLGAWAAYGSGSKSRAYRLFDAAARNDESALVGGEAGIIELVNYHISIARALEGDIEGAIASMVSGPQDPNFMEVYSSLAYAKYLTKNGEAERALDYLSEGAQNSENPVFLDLRERISSRRSDGLDVAETPKMAVAELFKQLSRDLKRRQTDSFPNLVEALIYARFAEYLNPSDEDLILLIGEIQYGLGAYQEAIDAYETITKASSYFYFAQKGAASAFMSDEQYDAAERILKRLVEDFYSKYEPPSLLGDVYRAQEQFADAELAYAEALRRNSSAWYLHYHLAMVRERQDKWDLAEKDFRHALTLTENKGQKAYVQNYLGYSLIEKRRNLEEALDMISEAVEALPDNGYITDSLGWAYYRLGDYQNAVEPMERAVELISDDPIINDHLGDVYWKVGRLREARFQWRRALSFGPEPEEIDKIRRKLEVGLTEFEAETSDQAAAQ